MYGALYDVYKLIFGVMNDASDLSLHLCVYGKPIVTLIHKKLGSVVGFSGEHRKEDSLEIVNRVVTKDAFDTPQNDK